MGRSHAHWCGRLPSGQPGSRRASHTRTVHAVEAATGRGRYFICQRQKGHKKREGPEPLPQSSTPSTGFGAGSRFHARAAVVAVATSLSGEWWA